MSLSSIRLAVAGQLGGLFLGMSLLAVGQQPPPPPPMPGAAPVDGPPAGVQELTRGPIHEAFGRPVVYDPHPGPVAPKEPPPPVEELPPGERPVGNNVAWIPGYWAWDDEANQFLWVSGFWREIPPGRTWVPGYWDKSPGGFQWVSGFWAPADGADTQYLPDPPQSLEAGPATPPPAADQIWVPGLWVWQGLRYVWQPGFWIVGNPDWVWTPARYQWGPLGYTCVAGYWDLPLWRRGLLFAPVRFTGSLPPTFVYTPRLVLDASYLGYDLFVRPLTGWYYFGDYYANSYLTGGYYPWFSYQNSRFGYDPLFAHTDWVYARQNINWEARLRETYYHRRDVPAARPARLYADYARRAPGQGGAVFVRPLAEVRGLRDFPLKMERIDAARVGEFAKSSRAVRDYGVQRARLEREAGAASGRVGPGGVRPAVQVRLPEAPRGVVGVPAGPKGLPVHPVTPEADLTRKPEPRVIAPSSAPPVGVAHPLPHPEQVLHPEFDRREAPHPVAPVAPVRPTPPPAAFAPHPVQPPITGVAHPAHVQAPPARKR